MSLPGDPLACECQAIDGRDPKCWAFDEYRDQPMPLGLTAAPTQVAQSAGDAPEIGLDGIVNAASFANRTLPSGGIAQGSIFSIFGSKLGPAQGVPVTSFPLATELAGVRVRAFTLDATVDAIPLFVSAGQINAIMPSNTPLGYVAVEVTYNGVTGNVAPARIEPSNVGIFTATGVGFGPGSITNFVSQTEAPPNTTATAATPGQFVTLWATGLGAIDGADNQRPIDVGAVQDLRRRAALGAKFAAQVDLDVYVGSKRVTNIFYAGRSAEFAGLDQIIMEVPADSETGCNTQVTVITNGLPANGVVMALAPQAGPCTETVNPLSSQTATLPGKTGAVSLTRLTGSARNTQESPFETYSADIGTGAFVDSPGGVPIFSPFYSPPPPGSCVASREIDLQSSLDESAAGEPVDLDAGRLLTVTRFDSEQRTIFLTDEDDTLPLGGDVPGFTPEGEMPQPLFLDPGEYVLSGDGGSQVGPIDATVIVPQLPVWTNRADVRRVPRGGGLRILWTGGSADQLMLLVGSGANGIPQGSSAFVCSAYGSAGVIDVPAYILATLPATPLYEDGALMLFTSQVIGTFEATGIDSGVVTLTLIDYEPVLFE
jgi:uncharacterized protein (TIGR03437 family)